MSDFCIVRQPVFGSTGSLIGYDIRFTDSEAGQSGFAASLLSGTFDLVRNRVPAFVTATRDQLLSKIFLTAEPGSVILTIPASLDPDVEVIEAIAAFMTNGGKVALDGIGLNASPAEILLPRASWVRIDSNANNSDRLAAICTRLKASLPPASTGPKFLATGIEELSHYEATLSCGFEAFQGGFFSRPEPLPAAEMPQSTVAAMRLLGMARNADIDDRKLEDVIATDPVLTFQLLRLVNSAALGGRGVSSIGQALRLIGRNAFLRWLAVAVAAARKSKTGVDQELVRQALERGRFLEQLSGRGRDGGTLFLVGLFSLLDSVFRMPLPEILERIVLSEDATNALLNRDGPYAIALDFAESYELGLFENAGLIASDMGVDADAIGEYYTTALSWTAEALNAVQEPEKPRARRAS